MIFINVTVLKRTYHLYKLKLEKIPQSQFIVYFNCFINVIQLLYLFIAILFNFLSVIICLTVFLFLKFYFVLLLFFLIYYIITLFGVHWNLYTLSPVYMHLDMPKCRGRVVTNVERTCDPAP